MLAAKLKSGHLKSAHLPPKGAHRLTTRRIYYLQGASTTYKAQSTTYNAHIKGAHLTWGKGNAAMDRADHQRLLARVRLRYVGYPYL